MRFKCHACDNIIESEQTCNLMVFVGLIWIKEEDGGSGAWKQRKREHTNIPSANTQKRYPKIKYLTTRK